MATTDGFFMGLRKTRAAVKLWRTTRTIRFLFTKGTSFMSTNLFPAAPRNNAHTVRPYGPADKKGPLKIALAKCVPTQQVHRKKRRGWNLHKSLMPGERAPQFRNCSIEPGVDGWAKRSSPFFGYLTFQEVQHWRQLKSAYIPNQSPKVHIRRFFAHNTTIVRN